MNNLIKKLLILILPIIAVSAVSVSAEEYGYIFKLKPDAILPLSVSDGIERIVTDEPVYSAKTLEDVYNFVNEDSIELIAENVPFYLFDFPEDSPNDPYYTAQWNLPMINIEHLWQKGYRGDGATVCIIDSGLYIDHPDIDNDNIIDTYEVFSQTDDVTDTMGHGTFVTGTIAATINNKTGISGIADEADIISIKAFSKNEETHLDNILSALDYANNCSSIDVLNMSLGATGLDSAGKRLFQEAVNKLIDKGVIIVAAVGNDGNSVLNYPAAFDNVIGVGAVANNKEICYFSQKNNSVFVVAPGGRLAKDYKTGYIDGLGVPSLSGSLYIGGDGTSFAAPQVASVAAIAKSIYPDLTASQFMDILKETSEDLGQSGYDTSYGYGLIDAEKIINEVISLVSPVPTESPAPTPFVFDPDNYKELTYENGEIIVETSDTDAVVYAAEYENGILLSLKSVKLSDLSTGDEANTGEMIRYTIKTNGFEPNKIFLWHGIQGCIEAWSSTEEQPSEPTEEPDITTPPTEKPDITAAPTKEPDITTAPTEKPDVDATISPSEEPAATPTVEPDVTPSPNPEQELLDLINKERIEAGLLAFSSSDDMTNIAHTYSVGQADGTNPDINNLLEEADIKLANGMYISISNIPVQENSEALFEYLSETYEDFTSLLLTSDYTHLGIGLAATDSGEHYLTFLFYTPINSDD